MKIFILKKGLPIALFFLMGLSYDVEMDLRNLIEQIKLNCNISDAKYWGYYSICGMLMRLRELYRSEHNLMPWDRISNDEIGDWITSRESLWEELEDKRLQPIEIEGTFFDPFDVNEINAMIEERGYLYGGGYGRFNKPTFHLSDISYKREIKDFNLYYTGREYCQDLSASVAMLQGRCIFVRLMQLQALLWERLQELRGRRFGGALREAFSLYGLTETDISSGEFHKRMELLSTDVSEILVLHEMGEAFEDEMAEEWLSILRNNTDRRAEFYLRGIKDILSDTSDHGPLKEIVLRRDTRLLYFYIVLLDPVRKELFPEIMNAFQGFVEGEDWSLIEEARVAGYIRADKLRKEICKIWRLAKNTEYIVCYIKGGTESTDDKNNQE